MTQTPMKTLLIPMFLAIAMIAPATANAQSISLTNSSGLMLQANGAAKSVEVGYGQVKDDLFAGAEKFAQGASEVTEVNLDPSMMGMVGGNKDKVDKDDKDKGSGASLARKMNFMVIHSYKYDKPGMYSMEDFQAYSKKLTDGTWNCYIHVREKNGSTDICARTGADHETNEMVILTAEPKELTFIHMSGKMSLNELNRMSNSHGSLVPR